MPILRGDFDKVGSDRVYRQIWCEKHDCLPLFCQSVVRSGIILCGSIESTGSYIQEVEFTSKTIFPFPLLRLYGRIKRYSLGLSPGWRLRSASCCQSHPPWKICPPPPPPLVTLSQKPSLPQPPLARWLKSTTIRRRRDPGILPRNVCGRVTCAWLWWAAGIGKVEKAIVSLPYANPRQTHRLTMSSLILLNHSL